MLKKLESTALEKIGESIEDGSLILPRIPEVVRRIDDAMTQEDVSIKEISDIIKFEPSISARIIQIANSPLVRGNVNITSLQGAITRVGLYMVRNLVLCMGLKDSFVPKGRFLRAKMKALWDANTAVAMYSYALSKYSPVSPDYAMMAGMLHGIGKLPIIDYVGKHPGLIEDERVYDYLVDTLHKPLGVRILRQWELQDDIIDVVEYYNDLRKERSGLVDVVDIVILAYGYYSDVPENPIDWYQIPALDRLGLTPDDLKKALRRTGTEIAEIAKILFT